ncbi:MAG: NAD(P)-dependent glycerol-1-phosphate dehydrogenase [Thermoplasmata archaeon]
MVDERNRAKISGNEGFNKFKSMELPRAIVVGNDALEQLGETCIGLKLKGSALLVCDPTTRKIAGDRVGELMEKIDTSIEIVEITKASQKVIDKVVDKGKDGFDMFFGVGGGVPIDVAKYSSYLLGLPFISVSTAASHDGIASARASIERDGAKVSVNAHTPLALIADTGIIAKSPPRLLASGCGDILANSTAVKDWILAKKLRNEPYSNYAANLSEMTAYTLIDNADSIKPGLEESAWMVVKALVSSSVAMSIAGSSRPASGSEHMFSHSLDTLVKKPALHGEQCGVGTIIMMYLHGGDWKQIKNALEVVGAPTTAKGLEQEEEDIVEALVRAPEIRPDRYTILGTKRMDRKAAESAIRETGVI